MTDNQPAASDSVPLWLLDVDGVLNAVALEPDYEVWPQWRRGVARTDYRTRAWPIQWSPAVVEALCSWRACGRVEVTWLTTWASDANDELAALLGMPLLPVAGAPPRRVRPSPQSVAAGEVSGTHAVVAGADAEDPLTGRWWKFDVVRRLAGDNPRRRLVWTDDDLAIEPEVMAWMRAHTSSLLIAPDPRHGLTPAHMQAIDQFLAAPAAS